jgi:hypothetical protein
MSMMVYLHTVLILFMLLFCIKAYFLMEDLFDYLKSETPTQRDWGGITGPPPPPPRPTNWDLTESNEYEGLHLSKYEDEDIV